MVRRWTRRCVNYLGCEARTRNRGGICDACLGGQKPKRGRPKKERVAEAQAGESGILVVPDPRGRRPEQRDD